MPQVMLAQNKGDVVLPLKLVVPGEAANSVIATATYDKAERTVIVKVVNAGSRPVAANVNLRGVGSVEPTGTALVLTGDPTAVNTLDEPRRVDVKRESVAGTSASFRHTFPPHSLTVLRLKRSPGTPEARRDQKSEHLGGRS